MKTSFVGLVQRHNVARVEIPIIQRDYAQGRPDALRIRDAFLDVLRSAITAGSPVHLDFVYGDIECDKLVPLDGQQRLTALSLLHWYVAARAGVPTNEPANRLPELTYEIRHSSRLFCARLAAERPSPFPDREELSRWLRDRNWFVRAWRHDPTIESMLVVLDAIHDRLADADCSAAWRRLADVDHPSVTFDFLAIENLGLTDDLYIKMNSRGKPLTPFESFKAEFESLIRDVSQSRYDELCAKIDNEWSDVFWRLRAPDNLIDDSFARYVAFLTHTLAAIASVDLPGYGFAVDMKCAELVYGKANPDAEGNLRFLFSGLDVWCGTTVREWFDGVFTLGDHQPGKVTLFEDVEGVDLMTACCKFYTDRRESANESFPLWRHLLLFAVVQHRRNKSAEFADRIRTLRNLALNSQNEIREQALGALLRETALLITEAHAPVGFNRRQLDEEGEKAALVASRPALKAPLQRLEDHPLLRGCLAAFDLNAAPFERRADTFAEIFSQPNGAPVAGTKAALLACGDYCLRNRNWRFQFGTDSAGTWRELFAGADVSKSKPVLEKLLDEVGTPDQGPIQGRLRDVVDRYLAAQESNGQLDWRYYLAKYDEMHSGRSGIYAGSSGPMSFSLCMLDKKLMNSTYRDPFLFAICMRSGLQWQEEVLKVTFTGPAIGERWLELKRSGAAIRCVEEGFRLRAPADAAFRAAFDQVTVKHAAEADGLVRIPQTTVGDQTFDTQDRVLLGVHLLTDLVGMQPA